MEEIRPKVLPKLREENENAKKKTGKKKKGIKDVVSTEEFEVVIFLKELSTRHSLLTKQKSFADKPKLKSTGSKLTGWLNNSENPIDLAEDETAPDILREEDDDIVELYNIPAAETGDKRKASNAEEDGLFVNSDDGEAFQEQDSPPRKQRKRASRPAEERDTGEDEKKKMALNTSYDGFSIYGRTLCLVVRRKGKKAAPHQPDAPLGGSQMMEQWVSTQAAQDAGLDEDEDG